jgi:hypothetical protein
MAGPSGIVGDSALGKDSQRKLGDPAVGERQRNQRFARIHNRDNGVGRESDRHRGGRAAKRRPLSYSTVEITPLSLRIDREEAV